MKKSKNQKSKIKKSKNQKIKNQKIKKIINFLEKKKCSGKSKKSI